MTRYRGPRRSAQRRRMVQARPLIDQQYREWLAANTEPKSPRPKRVSRCSDVTSADGTVSILPALSARELREVAPHRETISPALRIRVLRRDHLTCRYCGNMDGPFEIDHVIPVIKGGATTMRNLVTSCVPCNRRKGAEVWRPTPL